MIAKCANCKHVFNTDHYGPQVCPACGAELMLSPPPQEGAPAPSPSVPAAISESPAAQAEGGPTPWEERGKRGFFAAYMETLKLSLTDPVNFFSKMRVDNTEGAVSYYWLNVAIGGLVGMLWQAAISALSLRMDFGSVGVDESSFSALFRGSMGPQFYVLTGVGVALLAPLGLFISAGIYHLFGMLFRSANRGFDATLRTVAYASGPSLLQLVPLCGGVVGGIWMIVLTVIGYWKTQRTSVAAALAVVLIPIVLAFCCVCVGAGILFSMVGNMTAALGKQ